MESFKIFDETLWKISNLDPLEKFFHTPVQVKNGMADLIKEKNIMITISLKTAVMEVNLKVAPTLTITEAIYKHYHTSHTKTSYLL